MPAQIIHIDLAQPLPTLRIAARYPAAWLFVKFGPQPIGRVLCEARTLGRVIEPDALAKIIADTFWREIHDAAQRRLFDPIVLRHSPMMSIVICTTAASTLLERQLQSISQLQYPHREVIVVSSATREPHVATLCAKYSFVRHVFEPRPGLNYVRNTGWQVSRGEIVAYVDDDGTLDPLWLTALAANYQEPRIGCVSGLVLPLELQSAAQEQFERHSPLQIARRVYKPGTASVMLALTASRLVGGTNISFRRSTLAAIGGFDVALDAGSIGRGGGIADITARVLRHGGEVVYDPRAICYHTPPKTFEQLRRRVFDHGFGRAACAMKYAHDLEVANLSIRALKQWFWKAGALRLAANLRLAAAGREHCPIQLIFAEMIGAAMGLRAYRRSARKVRNDQPRFQQRRMFPTAATRSAA
jgi:glycosyltransferase involved in cell wall biosynthesis